VVYAIRKPVLFLLIFVLSDRVLDRVLRHGLEVYFGFDRSATVLCVGHSRTMLGIDGPGLERQLGVPVAKYAVNGANLSDRFSMVRQFLEAHSEVQVVVMDVDAFTFTDDNLSSNSYRLFFPFQDDPGVESHLRASGASSWDVQARKWARTLRYDETTLWLALRGLLSFRESVKHGSLDVDRTRRRIAAGKSRSVSIDGRSERMFGEMIRWIRDRNVRVFLVFIPTADVLNEQDRTGLAQSVERLQAFASDDAGIVYLDYNSEYEHRHDLFIDELHLNRDGQREITARLAADLKRDMRR